MGVSLSEAVAVASSSPALTAPFRVLVMLKLEMRKSVSQLEHNCSAASIKSDVLASALPSVLACLTLRLRRLGQLGAGLGHLKEAASSDTARCPLG